MDAYKGRMHLQDLAFGIIDLVLAALFTAAFVMTRRE